jgi:hypothetical protein
VLQWNWRLRSIPTEEQTETIQIPWSDPGTPATQVTFHVLRMPRVRGLVKQLYCGQLDRGQAWRHTMTLYTPPGHPLGAVKSVRSTASFITVGIERQGSLTLVQVAVLAPDQSGEIDERLEVEFENLQDAVETVRVSGTVGAVSGGQ